MFSLAYGYNSDSGGISIASYGYESADVLVATNKKTEEGWVLDSRCSFHMCPIKNWFENYQEVNGGKVIMGNNAMCRITGIGNVKLKLNDDTVRIVTNVRHVPEMKRNLISLGMLESEGCSYTAEDGILKVLRESLVIMKGLRENGIYLLQGLIACGELNAMVFAASERTKLWHQRLGHVSECGLQELYNQGLLGKEKLGGLEFC